jgi:3-deoxy-D-manno-octulosonic-acid transferase
MLVFYNIGVRFYYFGVVIASSFSAKAKLWLLGRENLLQKIEQEVSGFSEQTIWVHCASLGEFEMVRPIIEGLKQVDSKLRIILTFYSPSGYEVRKNYDMADHVFYLPLDTRENASRFIKAIKPNKTIFVKYDLWFNYLNAAKGFGSKLILISAQFRPSQPYFKFYGGVGRDALKLFDQIFLVDSGSEKLMQEIGIENTTVCGDTRYDRVMEIVKIAEPFAEIERFKGDGKLVVCGSTWPEDERNLASLINKRGNTKWIIAPHEVGESNIMRLEKRFPDSVRLSNGSFTEANVIIVDSVGQLNKLYRFADVAYVGGGFKSGLHNILEATAYGVPTVFGPNHSRFLDAGEMASKGLAFSVLNESDLQAKITNLLEMDQSQFHSKVLEFMNVRTGATKAILEYTKEC